MGYRQAMNKISQMYDECSKEEFVDFFKQEIEDAWERGYESGQYNEDEIE